MSRRVALITGGTSGLGRGIAERLAPEYDLALAYASDEAKAEDTLRSLREQSPDCRVNLFKGVLSSAEDCGRLHGHVSETFGTSPSVLVNAAGRLSDGLLLNSDFTAYAQVVQEHLIVAMALTQVALKPMYKNRFGRIINLSSISGSYAKRGQSNYAAAKAGIEGFTRTLALEVAHRGVTVNAISPGLFETPMTRELLRKIELEGGTLRERIPAGRVGRPSEVGALAAFLCSDDASYITGTVITIDGGRSLGDPRS